MHKRSFLSFQALGSRPSRRHDRKDCVWSSLSEFFEAFWHGEGIGDGGDLQEALQAFVTVKPDDNDWIAACAVEEAAPRIERFPSFDAYLDNQDPLEVIEVTAQMIVVAIEQLPV